MKQNKKTPVLRFPEFYEKWEEYQIDDLVKNKILDKPLDWNHWEIHPKSSDFVFDGIPFVMSNNIKNGILDISGAYKIKKEQADNLQKGFSIEGDVLLTHKGSVGMTAIVPKLKTDYIMLTPQVTYYRVTNKIKLKNTFLRCYFDSFLFQKNISIFADSGTRPYIGITEQRNLFIKLPCFLEQQKIADFFIQIDNRIKKITKKKELLEKYKKCVMQKIFNQEIRFKNDNYEDYSDWEVKKLGDVVKLQGGYAFKSELFKNEGVPIIRISNISNEDNYIDLKNIIYYDEIQNAENFTIKNGDLLLAMSGATTGKSSIYNLKFDAYLNQRVGLFKLKESNFYYPFLIQFVFSIFFKKQLDSVLVAGAQPNISSSSIENFYFNVPCLEEQQKIANFLTEIDNKINLTEKQLN